MAARRGDTLLFPTPPVVAATTPTPAPSRPPCRQRHSAHHLAGPNRPTASATPPTARVAGIT